MADFSVTSTRVGEKVDTRWRAGKHGQNSARSGQLDPSKFTSGTHYNIGGVTDNVIPSGVALGIITASGLYGPYDSTAVDGRNKLAGYINDDAGVSLGANPATAKPTVAVLVHGIVKASLLPIAAQRAAVLTATATASIVYVED
jgi:hypothetical protein